MDKMSTAPDLRPTEWIHRSSRCLTGAVWLAVVVALTACSGGHSSSTYESSGGSTVSGSPGSGDGGSSDGSTSGCFLPGFNLPKDNPNPHGATPELALSAFLAHGSVFGAAGPIVGAAKAHYPTTGWRKSQETSDTATFVSGGAEFDFTRVASDAWVITGGKKNC